MLAWMLPILLPAYTPPDPAPVETEAPRQIQMPPQTAEDAPESTPEPNPYSETQLAMLARNNALRASQGLPAHRMNQRLARAAQRRAEYMARTGRFSHRGPDSPAQRAQREGYGAYAGENIAYTSSGSVQRAFTVWRNSSGHWRNLRGGHQEAGMGAARAANGRTYWVAMYGRRVAQRTAQTYRTVRDRPVIRALFWWRR